MFTLIILIKKELGVLIKRKKESIMMTGKTEQEVFWDVTPRRVAEMQSVIMGAAVFSETFVPTTPLHGVTTHNIWT
jgi:hypothetical protein